MLPLGGHLGSSVSALVDGQLDPETTERAWAHALGCAACRRLVQREGWVKTRLASTHAPDEVEPSDRLRRSLYQLDGQAAPSRPAWESLDAWVAVDDIERRGRGRRRAGLALAGAGGVSAAVLGFASLSGAGLGIGGAPAGTPVTSVTRPAAAPTTAVVAPGVTVHGRLPLRALGGPRSDVPPSRR
jgi:hypothetical protein